MKCPRCGKTVPDDAKYCHICGMQLANDDVRYFQVVKLRCKECGATMDFEPDGQVAVCPFCGSKEMVIEDTEVTVERIKSKTARDLKNLDYKQFEEKKKLELEKLYYEENKKVRQNKREWQEIGRLLLLLVAIMLAMFLFVRIIDFKRKISGEIHIPSYPSEYIGETYSSVVMELEDAGFTNITLKPLGDLDDKTDDKNGTVYKIMIDGDATPSQTSAKSNVKIIIYYHSVKD